MLFGRDEELEHLQRCVADRRPVVVVGEAGVGKTTLVRAALRTAGVPVLHGGGLATLTWKPWLAFERALGTAVPDADTAWVARWVADTVGDGVLFLDDAQWLDTGSRSVVPLLLESTGLVVAIRHGDPGSDAALAAASGDGVQLIPLSPLATEAAVAFVHHIKPEMPDASVVRLVERTGANPLLLEELARHGDPTLTLRRSVLARIADAGPAARESLELLAVAGRPLERRLLGPGADPLIASHLATCEDGIVAIRHDLLAEAVLDDPATRDRRRGLHAQVARLVSDAGEAARHHAAAGERDLAHARAMQAVAASSTPGERAIHLCTAAGSAAEGERDALVLEAAAAALEALVVTDEVQRLLDDLPKGGTAAHGRVHALQAWMRFLSGDPEGMREAVTAGLAEAGERSDDEVLLRILEARVAVAVDGFRPEAMDMALAAHQLARGVGRHEAAAEAVLGIARYLAGDRTWRDVLRSAIGRARAAGELHVELTTTQNLVSFEEADGSPTEARRIAVAAVERAEQLRCAQWSRQFRQQLVNSDFHAGRYGDCIDGAYALLGEPIDQRTRERAEQALAGSLIDVGRFDEARRVISEALRTSSPDKQGRWWFLYFRAELELWSGRPAEAVAAAEESLAWPGLEESHAAWPLLTCLWAATAGAVDREPQLVGDGGLALLRGAPHEAEALRALADGQPSMAVDSFDRAASLWAPYHRRGELRCRYGAGESMRLAGDVASAHQRLLVVEEMAASAGMAPLLRRIHRSLRQCGVRRSAEREVAGHGLTGREHEIVDLVARGLTNVEIGRRLGVSRSTVAAQVSSAMSKLGVTSRNQLASWQA